MAELRILLGRLLLGRSRGGCGEVIYFGNDDTIFSEYGWFGTSSLLEPMSASTRTSVPCFSCHSNSNP